MGDLIVKTIWIYVLAIAVSMLVALVIKGIVMGLQALERRSGAGAKPVAAKAPAHVPAASADEIPPEHVAAITAAIYAMLGDHRIVHIEDHHRASGWVAEGRIAHHGSHDFGHHPHPRR